MRYRSTDDADALVRAHIAELHEYNEVKDVALDLMNRVCCLAPAGQPLRILASYMWALTSDHNHLICYGPAPEQDRACTSHDAGCGAGVVRRAKGVK